MEDIMYIFIGLAVLTGPVVLYLVSVILLAKINNKLGRLLELNQSDHNL